MVDASLADAKKTLVPPEEMSRVGAALRVALIAFALFSAYDIRLFAIKTYGLVIHEFDPWFNFRATQYLADHGAYEFFHWYILFCVYHKYTQSNPSVSFTKIS